ncbi:5-formyltetrahydrofolate cyclo-ligase [Cupriavidus plantarum]|uniref:5-formyltetrahydrofolate cyclo-ligase n=1 Tax=Cupriavidus plantarum TaxID=942865 RepID=UPI0015C7A357|nr:5-formyltetrahydrofolate cyclo-ligase [Cupriavidus plantarum]NYH97656.1 5-formyltetrahydrofolate cyclo-ligase [Cupriavidus plantarum]CAG2126796.1 5-formyltetrahydrofolate cyclo-ligase [Cupriavidus plantarum]SMR67742.1 5-formyltetrahydrofolate cyclo-ligase [Cupriavidus plantarum]
MPPAKAADNPPDSPQFPFSEDRRTLRARLLAARASLPGRDAADASIATALAALLERLAVQCVGFYWPIQQEFDARTVVTRWLGGMPGRRAALPVVSAPATPLDFHLWTPGTPMREGRYGIPVPDGTEAATPDALIIPCVGFSADKFRLGYGGGFYDRTLAALAKPGPRPVAIGIGYEACRVPLEAAAHDLPMEWIVTEAGTM